MANIFSDLATKLRERVGQFEELVDVQKKRQESAQQQAAVEARLKQAQQLKRPLVPQILQKLPTIPGTQVFEPTSPAGRAIETAREAGIEIRERVKLPIEKLTQKIPETTLNIFEGISRTAGALAERGGIFAKPKEEREPFIPKPGETLMETLRRQPFFGEVVQRGIEKTPLGKVPLVAPLVGFISELLLPPYGGALGKAKFIKSLTKEGDIATSKVLIKQGIKDISDEEAETLARRTALLKEEGAVEKELSTFAESRARLKERPKAPEKPTIKPKAEITPVPKPNIFESISKALRGEAKPKLAEPIPPVIEKPPLKPPELPPEAPITRPIPEVAPQPTPVVEPPRITPRVELPAEKPTFRVLPKARAGEGVGVLPAEAEAIAKRFPSELQPGRKTRGFVESVKEEFPEIERVAGQYIPRSTDRLAMKARNLVKSDIETAERIARTATDDDSVAIASELIKHYADEAERAIDKATRSALQDRAAEVANITARNLTEQGKAVQAASILGRLTPEGQLKFAAREIQRYNESVEKARGGLFGLKKKIPELTGKQASDILTEMRAIQNMPDGELKAIRFDKLQKRIQDLVPSSLYQKMVAVWKAGLLTGLKTSGLNIFSNVSHFTSELLKDLPAIAVDNIASLFTGRRTLVLTTRGVRQGLKEGVEKGFRYIRTGFDERNVGVKLDYRRVNFGKSKAAKALQSYEEGVFHIIGGEDQPFYYGAKARSLYSQAIAEGKNQGLGGARLQKFTDDLVQNPTDEMLKYAVLDAETAVFQNQTLLGKAARAIQKIPGGEFVLPFGRTPSAVATQIIHYSPVGIILTIAKNIGKGRFDQRLFSQAVGRGVTGTAVLYLGAQLLKKNLVSLDFPQSERERELWKLQGRKPNSIRVGNEWRSAQILGPAGNLLLIGAHLQKALNENPSISKAAGIAFSGAAKSFSEQTFLTGINRTVEAITDPARSAEGYIGSTLASTVPTLVSDVARATDVVERRAETVGEKFIARIPGARETLEPQIDVLGKERARIGTFLEIMIDPTRPSPIYTSPVINELKHLWDGGFRVSPTLLGDREGYKVLTQEQNTDLWKRAGEITESKLNNLFKLEKYQKLEDDLKAKKVEEFIEKSKIVARAEKILQLTEGLGGDELKTKLSALKADGLMSRDVYKKYLELR